MAAASLPGGFLSHVFGSEGGRPEGEGSGKSPLLRDYCRKYAVFRKNGCPVMVPVVYPPCLSKMKEFAWRLLLHPLLLQDDRHPG